MKAPFEDLIIRLWDSVEKLGIGILQPTQMKRLSKAKVEIELNELIAANKLNDVNNNIDLVANKTSQNKQRQSLSLSILEKRRREDVNVASAVKYAYIDLDDSNAEQSDENIESDWIHRWRDYSAKVSKDELQQLWGKVLSGEVKKPGSISYRLMDFIDKLTANEIDNISSILSITSDNKYLLIRGVKEDLSFFSENGMEKDFFAKYAELGIISPSTTGAVNVQTVLDFTKFHEFSFGYVGGALNLRSSSNEEKINLLYYQLGTIGQELYSLSEIKVNPNYFKELKEKLSDVNLLVEPVGWGEERTPTTHDNKT